MGIVISREDCLGIMALVRGMVKGRLSCARKTEYLYYGQLV